MNWVNKSRADLNHFDPKKISELSRQIILVEGKEIISEIVASAPTEQQSGVKKSLHRLVDMMCTNALYPYELFKESASNEQWLLRQVPELNKESLAKLVDAIEQILPTKVEEINTNNQIRA